MRKSVIIATPDPAMGELIGSSLEDTHQYTVSQHRDPQSALSFLQSYPHCEYALIETNFGDARVLELAHAIRKIQRNIRLVLIARGDPSRRLEEIRPWRLLRKPIMQPDLLAAVDATSPTVIDAQAAVSWDAPRLTWLDDAALATRTLQQLTAETNVQEAIILREFGVWACTGRLGSASIAELRELILGSMDAEQPFDLLRYIRLGTVDMPRGVWAKLLLVNVILAVIYDLDTPVGEMRARTNALAEALSRPLLEQAGLNDKLAVPTRTRGAGGRRRTFALRGYNTAQLNFLDLLPDGSAPSRAQGYSPPSGGGIYTMPGPGTTANEAQSDPGIGRLSHPRVRGKRGRKESLPRPHLAAREEPGPFDEYSITYSCLLKPRFEHHTLTGNLAAMLSRNLPQICISYGWRLESMEVLADCLRWVASIPPTEAIADHMQMVRRLTSASLLEDYPEYRRENFSNDFWAPGYSVIAGTRAHTPAEIEAFVRKNRNGGTSSHYAG